jgi:hypothetical protein
MSDVPLILASDCKCIKCGKKAFKFFGMADPDCPQEPFCEKCLNKAKEEIYRIILGDLRK